MLRLLPSLLLVGIPAIIAGQVEYDRLPLSGDPIGVLLVAYLHLTTTPAGEVQCRSSRASILQHAGLESSPSYW
jgi:hypothetical protein